MLVEEKEKNIKSKIDSEKSLIYRKCSLLDFEKIIKTMNSILMEITEENYKNQLHKEDEEVNSKSHFYCKNAPSISVDDYLRRIIKYSQLHNNTLIIAMIYIDLCISKSFILTKNNIHR